MLDARDNEKINESNEEVKKAYKNTIISIIFVLMSYLLSIGRLSRNSFLINDT